MTLLTAVLIAAAFAQAPGKIVLAGDSTVTDSAGWGEGFRQAMGPGVTCVNLSAGGRSSKSFRDEGRWDKVIAEKPAYVLIQFGHNDQPGKGPARETDPDTTYRQNMWRYVEEVRAAGGVAVLVTSIVRRNFDGAGKIRADGLVPYAAAVRSLAAEKGIPLIDLYEITREQAERLGPQGSASLGIMKDGKLDTTHLGPLGQQEVGRMVAREFRRIFPAFASSN